MKRKIGGYCKFTVEKNVWSFCRDGGLTSLLISEKRVLDLHFAFLMTACSAKCFCQHKHESIHQLVIAWSDKRMRRDDIISCMSAHAQIKAHSRDESCKLYRRLRVEINRTIPKPNQCDHTTACSMNLTTHKPRALWDVMCCVFTVDHCGSGRGLWVGGVRGVRKRWVNLQTITHF